MDIVDKSKEQIYIEAFWLGCIQTLEGQVQNAEAETRKLRERLLNCIKCRDVDLLRLKERIECLQVNLPNKQ